MLKRYIIHYPTLLRLGIPIMIGQIGTIIMGFMDTLMIGHYGTGELAAAGFVNATIGLVAISALGFSYGLTPVVGALLGKGETDSIAQKLKNSLVANNILAIVMMAVLGVLYLNLHHLGLPEHLLPLMRPYLFLHILSFLPMMAFNAFKQFSDGIQDTRMPMWILLGSNVLNVLGNWLLIYGIGPFPEMGLAGAGMATLLSRFAMWAAFACIFHLTDRYKPYSQDFWKAHVCKDDLRQMFRLGFPIMLQMGMETASFSLSAFYVGWLGTTAMAAHQIMLTVAQLCYMLYYGMSAAVAVQVSYFRGAGKLPETRHVAFAGLHLNWILGLLTAVPIFLLRNEIGLWFSDSTEVTALVAAVIIPLCIYQFGDALQCTYCNALRGMEDVKPLVWIAFIAYFIVSLPLGYLFGFTMHGGLWGIWMAFPFGLTTAGILYLIRFLKE
ncbi:MAG: MATE family efflux transporter [Bacteroidaceae bacterium]|nr:MATE family efflux transporter [Bacteroidaceae bacterium]